MGNPSGIGNRGTQDRATSPGSRMSHSSRLSGDDDRGSLGSAGEPEFQRPYKDIRFGKPEDVPDLLEQIPEEVFREQLLVEKKHLRSYWRVTRKRGKKDMLPLMFKWDDYWLKYLNERHRLIKGKDRERLGKLNEQVDQLYARMILYRSKRPAGLRAPLIPLSEFRITTEEELFDEKKEYWKIVAGLVARAKEIRAGAAPDLAVETCQEIWLDIIKTHKDDRDYYRFIRSVLVNWTTFWQDWEIPCHRHFPIEPKFDLKQMNRNFYCEMGPETLYMRANAEFTYWAGLKNFFTPPKGGSPKWQRDDLENAPAWLKLGFRDKIVEFLNKHFGVGQVDPPWTEWRINWEKTKKPTGLAFKHFVRCMDEFHRKQEQERQRGSSG